jgi:hypothetical protein
MTDAMRELDIAELDFVAGAGPAKIIATTAVAVVCKGATEAFVGGVASGLETGGAGFVVAIAGGVAAAGCALGMNTSGGVNMVPANSGGGQPDDQPQN